MAMTAQEFPAGDDAEPRHLLWDAVEGRFHGPSLRRAMVARALTVPVLAELTGVVELPGQVPQALASETILKARRGGRIEDDTAIKILTVLDQHPPMDIVVNDR